MNEQIVEKFSKVWQEFDSEGKGSIAVADYERLLLRLAETKFPLLKGYEENFLEFNFRKSVILTMLAVPIYKDF